MRLMKSITRMVVAAAAAGLLIAPLAQADRGRGGKGYEYGYDRGYDRGYSRSYHRHYGRKDHYHRGNSYKYDRRHSYSYSAPRTIIVHRPPPVYYAPPRRSVQITHGYSYGPHYYSGYTPRYNVGHHYSYAPSRTVYISNYHNYGLYAPPRGYHWVRDHDRGDAILASVATGAIIGLVVGALAN